LKKGDKLVRGSTLDSFNKKIALKAARYQDPTNTFLPDNHIDEEDIDDIPPMDMNLGSNGD
jgi:hypothetical protein